MEKSKLILRLKKFYLLEVYQVDLYSSQVESVDDIHLKRSYERKALIEQEHVDYFLKKIREFGSDVSPLTDSSFAAAGFLTGKAVSIMGLDERYKLGMATEGKAISMYFDFIRDTSQDPELNELNKQLWYFMVDEEHHQFWFKERLARLSLSAH